MASAVTYSIEPVDSDTHMVITKIDGIPVYCELVNSETNAIIDSFKPYCDSSDFSAEEDLVGD